MFGMNDTICHNLLRMKIVPFQRLCARLITYGLDDNRSVCVEVQVAMFLHTVRYDERNQTKSFTFFRSSHTVSHYFHEVLHACLGLYREVVINATTHNSPYEKINVKPWYSYFQVRFSNSITFLITLSTHNSLSITKKIFPKGCCGDHRWYTHRCECSTRGTS